MELFYSDNIQGADVFLDADESGHCVRVLRHRSGDEVNIIDGHGTLNVCVLEDDNPKHARCRIVRSEKGFGAHNYDLTMAVCPTKNIDRYEWFCEKATELGVDTIVPVIGEHSERKVVKEERLEKILLSATKQSLKGAIPSLGQTLSVKDFIASCCKDNLNLIACCFEGEVPRTSIIQALKASEKKKITILIGPEGDFSKEEADLAVKAGFIPIHLGASRLRTETAALTAVEAVYINDI